MELMKKICVGAMGLTVAAAALTGCGKEKEQEETTPPTTIEATVESTEPTVQETKPVITEITLEEKDERNFNILMPGNDILLMNIDSYPDFEVSLSDKIIHIDGETDTTEYHSEIKFINEEELSTFMNEKKPVDLITSYSRSGMRIAEYQDPNSDKTIIIGWVTGSNTGFTYNGNVAVLYDLNLELEESENVNKQYEPDMLLNRKILENEFSETELKAMKEESFDSEEIQFENNDVVKFHVKDLKNGKVDVSENKAVIKGVLNKRTFNAELQFVNEEEMKVYLDSYRPLDIMDVNKSHNNFTLATYMEPDTNKIVPYFVGWIEGSNTGVIVKTNLNVINNEVEQETLLAHLDFELVNTDQEDDGYVSDYVQKPNKFEDSTPEGGELDVISNEDIFISTEWTDNEFVIDGMQHKYPNGYSDFTAEKWLPRDNDIIIHSDNDVYYDYTPEYGVMKSKESGDIFMTSRRYGVSNKDSFMYMRYINRTDNDQSFNDISVNMFGVSALYVDEYEDLQHTRLYPNIKLAGNVTFGTTFEDLTLAYGEPLVYDPDPDYANLKIATYETDDQYLYVALLDDFGVAGFAIADTNKVSPIWLR